VSLVIIRYLHFIGIIGLFSLLLFELYLIKPTLKGQMVKFAANVDLSYWTFGIVVLVTGILMTVSVGKGMDFYIHNPVYHVKVGLFLAAVAATIYPTWFLQTHRRVAATDDITIPPAIRFIIRTKLLVLVTLPLLAVVIAQGIGLHY